MPTDKHLIAGMVAEETFLLQMHALVADERDLERWRAALLDAIKAGLQVWQFELVVSLLVKGGIR